jgi:hypothetical protein
MHSIIASESSTGVALGIPPLKAVSLKIGLISNVLPGQIPGTTELLFAHNTPAIKVPWRQAMLFEMVHEPPVFREN